MLTPEQQKVRHASRNCLVAYLATQLLAQISPDIKAASPNTASIHNLCDKLADKLSTDPKINRILQHGENQPAIHWCKQSLMLLIDTALKADTEEKYKLLMAIIEAVNAGEIIQVNDALGNQLSQIPPNSEVTLTVKTNE